MLFSVMTINLIEQASVYTSEIVLKDVFGLKDVLENRFAKSLALTVLSLALDLRCPRLKKSRFSKLQLRD